MRNYRSTLKSLLSEEFAFGYLLTNKFKNSRNWFNLKSSKKGTESYNTGTVMPDS